MYDVYYLKVWCSNNTVSNTQEYEFVSFNEQESITTLLRHAKTQIPFHTRDIKKFKNNRNA